MTWDTVDLQPAFFSRDIAYMDPTDPKFLF